MWWSIFFFVAAIVVSYALAPRPKTPDREAPTPAGLEDFNVPTAKAGIEIPVLFGTRWLNAPNVVWYGDLKIQAKKEKAGGIGK